MSDDTGSSRVCTTNVSALPLGLSCPDCGHSGYLHPYAGGALKACVLCELLAARDGVLAEIEAARRGDQ